MYDDKTIQTDKLFHVLSTAHWMVFEHILIVVGFDMFGSVFFFWVSLYDFLRTAANWESQWGFLRGVMTSEKERKRVNAEDLQTRQRLLDCWIYQKMLHEKCEDETFVNQNWLVPLGQGLEERNSQESYRIRRYAEYRLGKTERGIGFEEGGGRER